MSNPEAAVLTSLKDGESDVAQSFYGAGKVKRGSNPSHEKQYNWQKFDPNKMKKHLGVVDMSNQNSN